MSREILSPTSWKKPVSILWGLKDRWLDFNGVENFAKTINARLVQLPQVHTLDFPYCWHNNSFSWSYISISSLLLLLGLSNNLDSISALFLMRFVHMIGVTQVGHHAQEDFGEEVGKSLKSLLKQVSVVWAASTTYILMAEDALQAVPHTFQFLGRIFGYCSRHWYSLEVRSN